MKWNIKYVQILPAPALREILEKVFLTNRFTQYKTSRTSKSNAFEIPDNKNMVNDNKLFSKQELTSFAIC